MIDTEYCTLRETSILHLVAMRASSSSILQCILLFWYSGVTQITMSTLVSLSLTPVLVGVTTDQLFFEQYFLFDIKFDSNVWYFLESHDNTDSLIRRNYLRNESPVPRPSVSRHTWENNWEKSSVLSDRYCLRILLAHSVK